MLTALAEANINVDMIIQNEPQTAEHLADMSFTVPRDDVAEARESLEALQPELGFGAVQSDDRMGKVSVVGAGMKSHPGVAAKTFTVLGDAGVNIEMISTSPIKISCVVREEHVADAVAAPHRVRARRRRRAARGRGGSAPPEGGLAMRVAVVGATGAVGWMLDVLRERSFPADEVVRSPPSARRAGPSPGACRSLTVSPLTTSRSRASTSRCSRPAPR